MRIGDAAVKPLSLVEIRLDDDVTCAGFDVPAVTTVLEPCPIFQCMNGLGMKSDRVPWVTMRKLPFLRPGEVLPFFQCDHSEGSTKEVKIPDVVPDQTCVFLDGDELDVGETILNL